MMATFIANPNETFKRRNIKSIFIPDDPNSGVYVPNKDDIVVDTENNIEYLVTEVNYQTGVSTLKIWNSRKLFDPVGNTDHFASAGLGTIQDTFRLLVDTSKQPYVANLDSRLAIPGTNASYVVFYKDEDATSEQAQPVSMYFDDTSTDPIVKVPLIPNKPVAGNDPAIQTTSKFYANQHLSTNDIVTMVVYDDSDKPLSEKRLSVYNTSMVRKTNAAARYISSMQLETAALSENNDRLVEIPVNTDVNSFQYSLRIRYSDGSSELYPVDGTKAKIVGLEDFMSNRLGNTTSLQVRYVPSPGEYSAAGILTENGTLTDSYTFVTIRGNERGSDTPDSYAFKIHAYPRFSQVTREWVMEYYLASINRNDIYYITGIAEEYAGNFDGAKLGIMQRMLIRVNLNDVDESFNNHYHTQEVVVTLLSAGTEDYPPVWYMRESTGQYTPYGENIVVRGTRDLDEVTNRWGLSFSVQATSLEDWLNKVYYSTKPIFDLYRDGAPLTPTHVRINVGAGTQLAEIELTDTSIATPVIVNDFTYSRGELILFEFIKRTSEGDQFISVSGMPLVINNE